MPTPSWVRHVVGARSPLRKRIDRWLDANGVSFCSPTPDRDDVLGSGHFGSAIALNGSPGWVLKITRDPTEGPICDWIAANQRNGQYPFRTGFARMLEVAQLEDAITLRGKSWPVFLIIREEINPLTVSKLWNSGDRALTTATTELYRVQASARAIASPKKRGRNTVKLFSAGRGMVDHDPDDEWNRAVDGLISGPLSRIGETMYDLRWTHEVLLCDVHSGNVGQRVHAQPQETAPGGDIYGPAGSWLIFDPGHSVTNVATPKMLPNPRRV